MGVLSVKMKFAFKMGCFRGNIDFPNEPLCILAGERTVELPGFKVGDLKKISDHFVFEATYY